MTEDKGESKTTPQRQVPSIEFHLDLTSGVPTFMQIVQQVEHALRLGYLSLGDQLPKVRDVVAELAINPNTVMKAYRELEMKGLAIGGPGQGTFIEATLNQVALPVLTKLRRSLVSWVTAASAAGLDEDGVNALMVNVMREFRESAEKRSQPRVAPRSDAEGVA